MIGVRVVGSESELRALAPEWERLQGIATTMSIFSTYDWQSLWWEHYGKGQPLRVLVARDGGEVVGILPLYVQTVRALEVRVRVLRLVGTGGDTSPDDLGAILDPSHEDEIARAIAKAVLAMPGWDLLHLTDMLPESVFPRAMAAAAEHARRRCLTGRSEEIAFVALPPAWEDWLRALRHDRRYRIRKVRRKLHEAHPDARFFVWEDPSTLAEGVSRLGHLHRKRWQRAGRSHGFSSPEYIGFHGAVMAACLARDRLRLYGLEVSGQIVAMYYFYRFRDRVYLMQSGFDPDFASFAPGQVLLGHVIEHAIGEGLEVLDFLRGEHRYKGEIATGSRETIYVTVFGRGPAALAYRLRRHVMPAMRASLERALGRVRPGT